MKDSAAIKKQNKALIRKLLAEGNPLSKQQIAAKTGLSVASCNTYLNEMEQKGEVLGTKQKLHDVGRNTMVYTWNEAYESIACLYFERMQETRLLTRAVLSATGKVRWQAADRLDKLTLPDLCSALQQILEQFPNASQIVVGTPSIAENGVIRHCDLPELEGIPVVSALEARYHLPVSLANDMYYKAYGYYRKEKIENQIVTLVNYPAGVLPGTATIYNGSVLTGRNLFAGMVGFLDYGMSLEEQLRKMQRPAAGPLIVQAVIALISILNPHKLLFMGDLIHQDDLVPLRTACQKCIPAEYMPEFAYIQDITLYYLTGMFETAMDRKDEIN